MSDMFFETATGVETVPYHLFHRETKLNSRLVPGLVVGDTGLGTMKCPRCETEREGIGHGKKATCQKCGLEMQVWGNSLELLK